MNVSLKEQTVPVSVIATRVLCPLQLSINHRGTGKLRGVTLS